MRVDIFGATCCPVSHKKEMRVVTYGAAWCSVSHKKRDESGELWRGMVFRKSQNHKNESQNYKITNIK